MQEPWTWRSDADNTWADLQRFAKTTAASLRVTNVTFAVAIAKQRRDIAGRIEELSNSREAFIEIDDELMKHPASVPAVVCHEVMHKVLHDCGIWLPITAENEELTGIACVFSGLGKFMLNGCTSSSYGKDGNESTYVFGYVPRDELAFDHAVVCQLRGMTPERADANLAPEAAKAVRSWRAQLSPLSNLMSGSTEFADEIAHVIENSQAKLCEQERDIRSASRLLNEAKGRIASLHRQMNSGRNAIAKLKQGSESSRDFLAAVSTLYLKQELGGAISDEKIAFLTRHCRVLAEKTPPNEAHGESEVIECPIDGTRLRLPVGKRKMKVLCPNCKYSFLVSTSSGRPRRHTLRLLPWD